jgi:hypothetical protein
VPSSAYSFLRRAVSLIFVYDADQREGMGRLEFWVPGHAFLASFLAHGGVLCPFNNRSAPDRDKWCGPSGKAVRAVHHVQNHTSSQPDGPPTCWTSPLAFGLIGADSKRQHSRKQRSYDRGGDHPVLSVEVMGRVHVRTMIRPITVVTNISCKDTLFSTL